MWKSQVYSINYPVTHFSHNIMWYASTETTISKINIFYFLFIYAITIDRIPFLCYASLFLKLRCIDARHQTTEGTNLGGCVDEEETDQGSTTGGLETWEALRWPEHPRPMCRRLEAGHAPSRWRNCLSVLPRECPDRPHSRILPVGNSSV